MSLVKVSGFLVESCLGFSTCDRFPQPREVFPRIPVRALLVFFSGDGCEPSLVRVVRLLCNSAIQNEKESRAAQRLAHWTWEAPDGFTNRRLVLLDFLFYQV